MLKRYGEAGQKRIDLSGNFSENFLGILLDSRSLAAPPSSHANAFLRCSRLRTDFSCPACGGSWTRKVQPFPEGCIIIRGERSCAFREARRWNRRLARRSF